jgi:uncharacterized protein (DUF1800 family)
MGTILDYDLTPVKGKLGGKQIFHLLRRSLFGISFQEAQKFENKSVDECMELLLAPLPYKEMIRQEDPDLIDPEVENGRHWINASYENDEIDRKRQIYLKGWWVGQIIEQECIIGEKMVLFWHNHLVTEMDLVRDARYSYRYLMLLRKHAIGNVKTLIKTIITDCAMLVYLNGNSNTKGTPNENFARELLELFTIGKGYTSNYTEGDVQNVAKVLTGWKDNKEKIDSFFHPELHDQSDKQFSDFFDNYIIKGKEGYAGVGEIDELIDMIFRKKETAFFICKNIYRWFVSDLIDSKIEKEIITPLSEAFTIEKFEIKPILRKLLSSKHFFSESNRAILVKNPADFLIGLTKSFNLSFPNKDIEKHLCWIHYYYYLEALGMNIGNPPSVAGWPAYHQSPKFSMWWINSATLGFRSKILSELSSPEGLNCNGPILSIDYLKIALQYDCSQGTKEFISSNTETLFSMQLDDKSHAEFVRILNTDVNAKECLGVLNMDSKNKILQTNFSKNLAMFYSQMISMPEFQMY